MFKVLTKNPAYFENRDSRNCKWRPTSSISVVYCFTWYFSLPTEGRQEVRQASRTLGDIASMECLLTHLEVSEHPQKWQMFVDALENNG